MAGIRGKRWRSPRRAAREDPEAARRSKREREEARAAKPPPVSMQSTPTLTVETMHLSSRKVFVPDEEKPGPLLYSKREQHTYDTSSQTLARQEGTIEVALEHYNRLKGGTTCVELVPKYFFSELRCVSCVKMDPADPETARVRGCRICESRMFHPSAGGHRGAPTPHPADAKNKEDKPGPKTIKDLFDLWVCKMQK